MRRRPTLQPAAWCRVRQPARPTTQEGSCTPASSHSHLVEHLLRPAIEVTAEDDGRAVVLHLVHPPTQLQCLWRRW